MQVNSCILLLASFLKASPDHMITARIMSLLTVYLSHRLYKDSRDSTATYNACHNTSQRFFSIFHGNYFTLLHLYLYLRLKQRTQGGVMRVSASVVFSFRSKFLRIIDFIFLLILSLASSIFFS